MDRNIISIIVIIVLCTIVGTGSFIYATWDSDLSSEPNAFTGVIHTRGESYFMLGMCIFFISTLFWTFIYFAGKDIFGDSEYNKQSSINNVKKVREIKRTK